MSITREDFLSIKKTMINNGWEQNSMIPKSDGEEWGLEMVFGSKRFFLNVDTAENAPLDVVVKTNFDDDTIARFRAKFPTFKREHSKEKMQKMLDGDLVVVKERNHKYSLMTPEGLKTALQKGTVVYK